MAFETLTLEHDGDGVAILWMDRPEKLNAMTPRFFAELPRALTELSDDQSVQVCIITGRGRAFSAGGDIASFEDLRDIVDYRRQLRLVMNAFNGVERCEIPVIAAVNGIAYAGGTELTLACDLVIAADEARFALREATIGLMPGYAVVRGPDVIGRHWTRWLALTGDIIDAEQARQIGLVQRVVPSAQLLDEARAVAGRIAANSRLGVRVGKQFINRTTTAGLAEAAEATSLLFTSEDHKQRIRAFRERPR